MPRKNIKPYLQFETLERYCENPRELVFFMSGYFEPFTNDYENMSTNEIKRYIEDLKVAFAFLDRESKNE